MPWRICDLEFGFKKALTGSLITFMKGWHPTKTRVKAYSKSHNALRRYRYQKYENHVGLDLEVDTAESIMMEVESVVTHMILTYARSEAGKYTNKYIGMGSALPNPREKEVHEIGTGKMLRKRLAQTWYRLMHMVVGWLPGIPIDVWVLRCRWLSAKLWNLLRG